MKKKSNAMGHQNFILGAPVIFHLKNMERGWKRLAALAWSGYLAEGPGALLFTQDSAGGDKWDCCFFPLLELGSGSRTEKYRDMIKTYDPMTQVVVLLLTASGHVASFSATLPAHLAPPNACKSVGNAHEWTRYRKLVRRRNHTQPE